MRKCTNESLLSVNAGTSCAEAAIEYALVIAAGAAITASTAGIAVFAYFGTVALFGYKAGQACHG